jgi:hypothetical protein
MNPKTTVCHSDITSWKWLVRQKCLYDSDFLLEFHCPIKSISRHLLNQGVQKELLLYAHPKQHGVTSQHNYNCDKFKYRVCDKSLWLLFIYHYGGNWDCRCCHWKVCVSDMWLKVLVEKLIVFQLGKKFQEFYETKNYVTMFTIFQPLSCSQPH